MSKITKSPAIDLGTLQSEFTNARSHRKAAESALLRAQEARDRAVEALTTAQRALTDGTRLVLG